jgi:hypothetical protein
VALPAAAAIALGFAEVALGVDIHPARSLDGRLAHDLAPIAREAAAPSHELCTFRVHRYFLAAAFSYYRGPTVPIGLEFQTPEQVRAWLAPGSQRRCITTKEGLEEMARPYPIRARHDRYVVIASPPTGS